MKTILSNRKRLFDAQEKFIYETTTKAKESLSIANATLTKVDFVFTEIQTLKELIILENTSHHQTITGAINTLVEH